MFISKKHQRKDAREELDMSEEGDTFWVSLAERLFGLLLIVIGGVLLYYTATSTSVLGGFSAFFGFLSVILVLLGIFMFFVKPPE